MKKKIIAFLSVVVMTAGMIPAVPATAVSAAAIADLNDSKILDVDFNKENVTDNTGINKPSVEGTNTPSYVTGHDGTGKAFQTNRAKINLGDSRQLQPENLTVAFWVKAPENGYGKEEQIFFWCKEPAKYDSNGWYLTSTENYDLFFEAGAKDGSGKVYAGGVKKTNRDAFFPAGEWVHVAVTYNGSDMVFYRNGRKLETTVSDAGTSHGIQATDAVKYIGESGYSVNEEKSKLTGAIDDIELYRKAAVQEQIQELYSSAADTQKVLDINFDNSAVSDHTGKNSPVVEGTSKPSYVTGHDGTGKAFQTNGSRINLGNSKDLQPGSLTASFWVKAPEGGYGSDEQVFFWNKEQGKYDSAGWYLTSAKDYALFFEAGIKDSRGKVYTGGVKTENRNTFFPAGEWVHIVVTYNSDTGSIGFYRNGVKQEAEIIDDGASRSIGTSTVNKYVGESGYSKNDAKSKLAGCIDDIEIYSMEMTAEEVAQLDGVSIGQICKNDLEAVSVPTSVRENFCLPVTGISGSKIQWTSDNAAIKLIGTEGAAIVNRGSADVSVKLTATAMRGTVSYTKEYTVKVLNRTQEEYKARDAFYSLNDTSVNRMTSEHFQIIWGNEDSTGTVNEALVRGNLENLEMIRSFYMNEMGLSDIGISQNSGISGKYKLNLYIATTGLKNISDDWAYMTVDRDQFAYLVVMPGAMRVDPPSWVIPHELAHAFTYHMGGETPDEWYESLANYYRNSYLESEYNRYGDHVYGPETDFFPALMKNLSIHFPHNDNWYDCWPIFLYIGENPDHINGLGIDAVAKLMANRQNDATFFHTMERITGVDAEDIIGGFERRLVTMDFKNQSRYQKSLQNMLNEDSANKGKVYTTLTSGADGYMKVPDNKAPQQGGCNIIPLNVTMAKGLSLDVDFRGLSTKSGAGWRMSIVTKTKSGQTRYSSMWKGGTNSMILHGDEAEAYLVVSATPSSMERLSLSASGTTYPYEVKVTTSKVPEKPVETPELPEVLADFNFDASGEYFDGGNAKASGTYTLEEHGSGKALRLNGNGQFLNVVKKSDGSSLLTGVKEMTVSYQIKPEKSKTNWGFFAAPNAEEQKYTQEHYVGIVDIEGTTKAERYNNSGARPQTASYLTGYEGWYYVTVVYRADKTEIYINGEKKAEAASAYALADILGQDSILYIGKSTWVTGEYAAALLDNYKIVSRALTAGEIAEEAKKYVEEKPDPTPQPQPADKSALSEALKNAVPESDKDNYTPQSWEIYAEAFAKAEAVNADTEAVQADIDAAVKVLTDAQKALKEKEPDPTPDPDPDPDPDPTPDPDPDPDPTPVENPYDDVKEGDWFYNEVLFAYENHLMTGKKERLFVPYENIARAQFAVILYRLEGSPEVTYDGAFGDVPAGKWFSDAITWASQKDIVTGYTATGNFGPDNPITREELATMMYRYAKYKNYAVDQTAELDKYEDHADIHEFALDAVKWAAGTGIIKGKYEETQIDPMGNTLRGEAAIVLERFVKAYQE